jgi:hypothetical protein
MFRLGIILPEVLADLAGGMRPSDVEEAGHRAVIGL